MHWVLLSSVASIFDPSISDFPKHKLQECSKYLLICLIEIHVLVPKTCDQAVTEFNNYFDNEAANWSF